MSGRAMPGFDGADRAALNAQARELLEAALAEGRRASSLALYVTPEGVRIMSAWTLADELATDGVGRLARRLRRAAVPQGHVLVVVVGDDVALAVVPVTTILAPGPSVAGHAEPRMGTSDAAPRLPGVRAGATTLGRLR